MSNTIASPKVVSRDEWLTARRALLAKEKELTKQLDKLNAERRRLPMVKLDKSYQLQGPEGAITLGDLFKGKRQLIVYHFMFAPDWEKGCPSCSKWADEALSEGLIKNIEQSDTAFVCISRAPLAKLEKYKRENGWTFPWYSSSGTTFNYDFGVTLDDTVTPATYNYLTIDEHKKNGTGYYFEGDQPFELPGKSAFIQINGETFHTYSTFGRGCETTGGSHYFLDLTAYGRQESWEDSPPGFPQTPLHYDERVKSESEFVKGGKCCE